MRLKLAETCSGELRSDDCRFTYRNGCVQNFQRFSRTHTSRGKLSSNKATISRPVSPPVRHASCRDDIATVHCHILLKASKTKHKTIGFKFGPNRSQIWPIQILSNHNCVGTLLSGSSHFHCFVVPNMFGSRFALRCVRTMRSPQVCSTCILNGSHLW